MEADLYVLCHCVDEAQIQCFRRILDQASRPLLEDDAKESERDIFKSLADTEFPQYLVNVRGNHLFVHWWLGSRFEIDEIHPDIEALLTAGAKGVNALLYVDGAPQTLISATSGKSEMYIFDEGPVEGKLKPYSDEIGALIEYLRHQ